MLVAQNSIILAFIEVCVKSNRNNTFHGVAKSWDTTEHALTHTQCLVTSEAIKKDCTEKVTAELRFK